MTKGIVRLEDGDPLPWQDRSRVARQLIVVPGLDENGKQKFDQQNLPIEFIFVVYNEPQPGEKRPAGFGLPGGVRKIMEDSIDAVEREGSEEVPFPIAGEPQWLLTHNRQFNHRVENIDLYIAKLDLAQIDLKGIDFTKFQPMDRRGDVTGYQFFDKRHIWNVPIVDTRKDYSESDPERSNAPKGIFMSHRQLLQAGLEQRGWLIQKGRLKP